jgi:signal transduction histidine kinase
MAALAAIRAALAYYLTTTFAPMIGMLLAGGSLPSVVSGLLLLAFGMSTMALGARIRELLVRSLTLRFENVELIDDLSTAKDAAESASRAKSVLLANMSHELRTPLALILGPTKKLLSGTIDPQARRDLETVQRNAEVLLKHLSDLLDVAKLDAAGWTSTANRSTSRSSFAGPSRSSTSWRAAADRARRRHAGARRSSSTARRSEGAAQPARTR